MALQRQEIDLHGYTVAEALFRLEQIIPLSYSKGVDELLVIHGKGEGVLRSEVLSFLRSGYCRQYVQSVQPGDQYRLDGGQGVVKVIFKIMKVAELKKKSFPVRYIDVNDSKIEKISDDTKAMVDDKKRRGKDRYLKMVNNNKINNKG
ncbi:MAG: hypothetical protein DKM50_12505 [Candidatus Margulisiibacteriota bacterium]|nr:MAG: hypothetical protein DKM50_12505 [Candidatus Margulisiibacteriota bacterium]HCY37945.1 hypothetical protein [Candidatus Margulisiibacteriota bacterium]